MSGAEPKKVFPLFAVRKKTPEAIEDECPSKKARADKGEAADASASSGGISAEQKALLEAKKLEAQAKKQAATAARANGASDEVAKAAAAAAAEPIPPLPPSWQESDLSKEVAKPYFSSLKRFLQEQHAAGKKVYPPRADIFSAFELCPLDSVKVVILGQDPYHGAGQAHGLSFSVRRGIAIPPSLRNMYKELKSDLGVSPPAHGHLEAWARQGVLMLNACLTVRHAEPNSHAKKGWEQFTDAVVRTLAARPTPMVFLLWGKPANEKAKAVNRARHRVISSSHPSPLGATKTDAPFIGSKCYSLANAALVEFGQEPVDWKIPA